MDKNKMDSLRNPDEERKPVPQDDRRGKRKGLGEQIFEWVDNLMPGRM